MGVVQAPIFHILEIGLLACVVFHGLNGIRVVLIDFGAAGQKGPHTTWAWATVGGERGTGHRRRHPHAAAGLPLGEKNAF